MTDAYLIPLVFAIIGEIIMRSVAVLGIAALVMGYIYWAVVRFEDCLWKCMTTICTPIILVMVGYSVLKEHGLWP